MVLQLAEKHMFSLCGRVVSEITGERGRIVIRGLCEDDRDKLIEFYNSLTEESIYSRFFSIIRNFEPYVDKLISEGAIVLVAEAEGRIVGVAEAVPDGKGRAEAGVAVLEAYQGRGIGTTLASTLMKLAGKFGIRSVYAFILADNPRAFRLARKLGFKVKEHYGDMVLVVLDLT